MSNRQKNRRPKYSLEFKKDAVQLVTEKGYTHEQSAKNLGISTSALGRWVRAEAVVPPKKRISSTLVEQSEWQKLRHQVKQLEMEREILKKAMVFFAKELE